MFETVPQIERKDKSFNSLCVFPNQKVVRTIKPEMILDQRQGDSPTLFDIWKAKCTGYVRLGILLRAWDLTYTRGTSIFSYLSS